MGCWSSAPIGTRAGAWTASCGAAPGRQGDPGETRFFVSLEDDLLVRHGGLARLIPAALVPARSDEPVEGAVLRREIARAQRVIEGQHWDIRRLVARYAGVVERQFETVVAERVALLRGEDPEGETLVRRANGCCAWRRSIACGASIWPRCADLRDGAHLARLGGRQPLDVYTTGATASFGQFHDEFESAAAAIRLAGRAGRGRALQGRSGGSSHDVDLSGERRSVPPHDGQPAHRPGGPDNRDVCRGDARPPVPGLGHRRSMVEPGKKRGPK